MASSRNNAVTAKVRPGTWITGHPPKYRENSAEFSVADIRISLSRGLGEERADEEEGRGEEEGMGRG
jgi:hypothetical protein